MDFLKLVQERVSVRGYRPDPIPDDVLNQVLEAGRAAPTAKNLQPFQILVIHTEGREEELRRIYNKDWFVEAPIVMVIAALRDEAYVGRRGKDYADVDCAIAMDHMILAATSLGLGTCWIGAFEPDVAREVLGMPDEAEPIVFTPLGYPDDAGRVKQRKPLDQIVRWENW
ncbi:MAG: nitroreductase family protein [Anaerolineae bacterium]|nr:nitroreductase family protein [Anaerolineae bacterium]